MSDLPDALVRPHPDRLPPDHPGYADIVAAHETAVAGGEDGYVDPVTGFWVFSAVYLWERGSCCDQGCRHCPWIERPGGAGGSVADAEPGVDGDPATDDGPA